jgi:hypothetical protein
MMRDRVMCGMMHDAYCMMHHALAPYSAAVVSISHKVRLGVDVGVLTEFHSSTLELSSERSFV